MDTDGILHTLSTTLLDEEEEYVWDSGKESSPHPTCMEMSDIFSLIEVNWHRLHLKSNITCSKNTLNTCSVLYQDILNI